MNSPTPYPTIWNHNRRSDEDDNNDNGLIITLSLFFGAVSCVLVGLCCYSMSGRNDNGLNTPLFGVDTD